MKSFTFLFIFFTFSGWTFSQITVNAPSKNLTIESIIQSIDGDGIIVQNITTNQKEGTNQLANFKDARMFTGMKEGMLLSTGSVNEIVGENKSTGMTSQISSVTPVEYTSVAIPNSAPDIQIIATIPSPPTILLTEPHVIPVAPQNSSNSLNGLNTTNPITSSNFIFTKFNNKQSNDTDMKAELGGTYTLFDACIVEMDIIPLGDTLSFRYMFASEEYDEYVGTQFNDAFAFFISGPGIEGKKNLAVLESGSRVSVNSINNGNPSNRLLKPSNPSFYNRNTGQIPLEFDGFTRTLEVVEAVTAFETYHLKIVIVDAGDGAYDSGVFIEEGSIISYDYKYIVPFDTDISNLDEKARSILLAMTQVAHDHPEYVLQITGHTDSDGSEASNLILSQNRINSVVNFIIEEGFSTDDLVTINKGESMPMTSNETPEGKKQNRRVEIKLIPSDRASNSDLISSTEMTTYPNPASTTSTIEVKSEKDFDGSSIVVYSTGGKLIAEQLVENSSTTFNTSDWEPGIYFYTLMNQGERITSNRLVVVH